MSDTKNVVFRTALGGFNKEDVNRYILTINKELEEKDSAAAEEKKRAEETEACAATLRGELDSARADKEALESILASLRQSLDETKETLASLTEKCDALTAENERLTARIAELENTAEEEDKSQKYDRISAQIGDIMISANTSADAIVAAANDHAAKIISDTENEAHSIRTRLSQAADTMLTHISGEMRTSADGCVCEMITALTEMRDSTALLIQDFEKRNRDLSVKVEYYQAMLSEAISKTLHELDEKYGVRTSGVQGER